MLKDFSNSFYPSFIADLLVGTLSAFLGIVGAYLIYLVSVRQIRKDRLKYIVSLIESIVPSALRQAEFCKEYAESIIKQPFGNLLLKLEANRDSKRLADKVEQEGVYHAYLWKYKRNEKTYTEFQNLYAFIDYLDSVLDDMTKTNEKILNAIWRRKKEYKIAFKKVSEMVLRLSLIEELKENQPELIEYSTKLLQEFNNLKIEGENLIPSFEIVIEPLRDYITLNGRLHPKITELLFLLDDLYNVYSGIKISVLHNVTDYEWYAEELKATANKLDKSSKQLQKDFSTKSTTKIST